MKNSIILFTCLFLVIACASEPAQENQTNVVVEKLAEQQVNNKVQQLQQTPNSVPTNSSNTEIVEANLSLKDTLAQVVPVKNVVVKKNIAEKKAILKQQFSNSVFLKNVACCSQIEEEECCCKGINSAYADKITLFLDGQLKAQVLADYKNDPLYNKCHQKFSWFSTAIKVAEKKIEDAEEEDW